MPFVPHAIGKDLVFAGLVMLAILTCAAVFGPAGPNGPPDPTLIETNPRPDFYFLPLFSVFALLPPYLETFLMLVGAGGRHRRCCSWCRSSPTRGEKSARRRPVAVLSVILIMLTLSVLAYLGTYSPWSPVMDAWSGAPTPVEFVKGRSPLELQGALVLQDKQCRNCHSLGGAGGLRGPALDAVATRLTRRPAHPPGPAGRRQHARLRQEPAPRRGHRAGRVHATLRSATTSRPPATLARQLWGHVADCGVAHRFPKLSPWGTIRAGRRRF